MNPEQNTKAGSSPAGRPRFCPNCGQALPEIFRFCPNCGWEIAPLSAAAPASATPPKIPGAAPQRPTELLHRPTELLHRPTEPLHRPTEPLHRATEPLHRATEPLHRPTEPLHRPTRPMEPLNPRRPSASSSRRTVSSWARGNVLFAVSCSVALLTWVAYGVLYAGSNQGWGRLMLLGTYNVAFPWSGFTACDFAILVVAPLALCVAAWSLACRDPQLAKRWQVVGAGGAGVACIAVAAACVWTMSDMELYVKGMPLLLRILFTVCDLGVAASLLLASGRQSRSVRIGAWALAVTCLLYVPFYWFFMGWGVWWFISVLGAVVLPVILACRIVALVAFFVVVWRQRPA